MIEPDYGLLDELLSLKALSRVQYDVIRNITTSADHRNDQLLQYVSQSDADMLIDALQKTDQQHVANFIQGNFNALGQLAQMLAIILFKSAYPLQVNDI